MIIVAPSSGSAWLPSAIRLPDEDDIPEGSARRQAIEYRDTDGAEDDSVRAEVNRLNNDSNLASHIESERTKSAGPWREHDNWRQSGEEA